MQVEIEAAIKLGQRAWPSLAIDAEVIRRDFEQLSVAQAGTAFADLCHKDLYLAFCCLQQVAGAQELFVSLYRPILEASVARLDQHSGLKDEVVQTCLDTALVGGERGVPALRSYSGRGDLRGWLRVIATREAYRILRASKQQVSASDDDIFDVLIPERDDPQLRRLKENYGQHFRQAFRDAIATLPRPERTALRLQVLDGLSIDKIAPTLKVHRATAARILARARDQLFDETRRLLGERLDLGESEVDSVIHLLQSRLDLSIETMLAND